MRSSQFLLTLWNVYAFFVTYANASGSTVLLEGVAVSERPCSTDGALPARPHDA